MPPEFPVECFLLLADWIMPMLPAPLRHRLQAAPEPLAHGAQMNGEITPPASLADVREAEEIKR
jgi:hypothetical protein